MISIKPEIENIINNKFMKQIQPTTTVYDVKPPSIYNNIDEGKTNDISIDMEQVGYKYLNDDPLNKIIEVGIDTEFNYVLYNIIDDSDKPYVKFLMNNNNNIMKFPNENAIIENNDSDSSSSDSETDDIIPFIEDDEEDEDDLFNITSDNDEYDEETFLPEQCSQYLKNNFGIAYDNSIEYYKGYVNDGSKIYIFIDTSVIDIEIPENKEYSWVIVDEIINKKSSNNIPICNIVIDIFSNNSDIKNIYNENNDIIEYPICVYICDKSDDNYNNIETTGSLHTSLISDKISHPIFGNITMFSTNHILNDNMYERYSLFTSDANFILHTNFTKSEVEYITDKSCIRFSYDNIECWSVKDNNLFSHI